MKKVIFVVAVFFSMTEIVAQVLDPTIEVSREYEGKLIEVHKPALDMSVPDTLYNFNLAFDYSVFDNPYKGSYEFNPYLMEMRPSLSDSEKNRFFLQAGAGYALHPIFDMIWSPVLKGPFSIDVYGTHRSYVGTYMPVGQHPEWKGYDLLSKAGVDLGYDWKKASLDFGASYYGIADKDYRRNRQYNALDAYATLKSKAVWPKNFLYGVDLAYRYAGDRSDYAAPLHLNEHNLKLDVTFGPGFGACSRMMFDVGVGLCAYEGALSVNAGIFRFVPHYVYEKGIFKADLGVKVSAVMTSGVSFGTKGQIVYPDIRLDLAVIPDAMKFYVHVGGGDRLNTYSSLIRENHHVDLLYGSSGYESLMNVTVERISAVAGFEGRVSRVFSYNLRGGYANFKSAHLDGAVSDGQGGYRPYTGYSPYQKYFVVLDWNLDLQGFRFDGSVEYLHSWGISDSGLVLPSSVAGDVAAMYNWNRRIYAGVDCAFASRRQSLSGFIAQGYADLGVYLEYAPIRRMSFWLRGGNLLNMEIQKNLLYAEKGVFFTAGICLNL